MVEIPEARIRDPIRLLHQLAQGPPELLLVAHDEYPAVAGGIELARSERRVRRSRQTCLPVALVEIPGSEIAGVGECHIEETHVHVAPDAALAGGGQRGQHRIGEAQAGHEVHHGQAEARRWRVRLAGQRQESRLRLHEVIEPRPARPWPGAAVGAQVRADDLRIALL